MKNIYDLIQLSEDKLDAELESVANLSKDALGDIAYKLAGLMLSESTLNHNSFTSYKTEINGEKPTIDSYNTHLNTEDKETVKAEIKYFLSECKKKIATFEYIKLWGTPSEDAQLKTNITADSLSNALEYIVENCDAEDLEWYAKIFNFRENDEKLLWERVFKAESTQISQDKERIIIEHCSLSYIDPTFQKNPLILALEKRHIDLAVQIIENAPELIATPAAMGCTALHVAVPYNDILNKMLGEDCLDESKKAFAIQYNGQTPLMVAILNNNTAAALSLLEADTNNVALYVTDHAKKTPLHTATIIGNLEIVTALLSADTEKKALCMQDTNGIGTSKRTPLHCAIEGDKLAVVQALLESDTEKRTLYIQDAQGNTPILLAIQQIRTNCSRDRVAIANAILDHIGNNTEILSIKTTREQSILELAELTENAELISRVRKLLKLNVEERISEESEEEELLSSSSTPSEETDELSEQRHNNKENGLSKFLQSRECGQILELVLIGTVAYGLSHTSLYTEHNTLYKAGIACLVVISISKNYIFKAQEPDQSPEIL